MKNIYNSVDLTFLKRNATASDIIMLCERAKEFKVASVCVPSYFVSLAKENLKDCDVCVCTVVGFPNGNCSTNAKVAEAKQAFEDGATEIDMVINIGEAVDEKWDAVSKDITAIANVVRENQKNNEKALLKVIVETCCLNKEKIERMCQICAECGAEYIKTSTGFAEQGATPEVVEIMKRKIDKENYKLKIKASGGIRTIQDAKMYLNIGASRIGASNLSG